MKTSEFPKIISHQGHLTDLPKNAVGPIKKVLKLTPDSIAMLNAALLTGVANVTKKPPLWGMAINQMKTMKAGFNIDGSKAERELGISYTPIRFALEEAIASIQK